MSNSAPSTTDGEHMTPNPMTHTRRAESVCWGGIVDQEMPALDVPAQDPPTWTYWDPEMNKRMCTDGLVSEEEE